MPFLRPLLLVVLACALCSCSTNFNRAWHQATVPKGIEGAWAGSWTSHHTGHYGELRCVVQPDTTGNGDRLFLYHAVWGGVLTGNFKSIHHVKQTGPNSATFTADSSLGIYGQFHAEGTIKNGVFKACYQAAGDNGVFEMKRPGK